MFKWSAGVERARRDLSFTLLFNAILVTMKQWAVEGRMFAYNTYVLTKGKFTY